MISPEEIVALYLRRKSDMQGVNSKRAQVRDAYNGELRVSLPDIGRNERAAVANLLNTGLDQLAMRVSSTLPSVFCPPRDEQVKREVVAADKRRKALYAWWEANKLKPMMRRRARHMLAYAQAPVLLEPDFKRGVPKWTSFDAMATFASFTDTPGVALPEDCVFSGNQSYGWVRAMYPDVFERLYRREKPARDDMLTVLRYVDAEEQVSVVLAHTSSEDELLRGGPWRSGTGFGTGFIGSSRYEVLERVVNRAGVCPVVIPGRITLDKMLGQFDGMLGLYAQMARLTALELIAVEKGIFPDTYLESRPGEQAKFLTGPHDGRTGLVNIIQGGTIREVGTNPGFQTNPTIDRLERAQRLTAGIPAELGGESASNIRTGKRGDAVLSAAVDFPVQEAQQVLAASLEEENKRAIAVAKGYFGSRPQSFYVSWKGAKGQVDFTAGDIFTTDHNVVEYSHVGSDLNGLTIMVGQLVGMGTMSKQTAAELLPIIEDPEKEHDRSIKEALEAALLASVQQKVNAGEIAPVDAAWLMVQVGSNRLELAEAIIRLDERVQKRQAAALDAQAAPVDPLAAMDPSMMGGLATGTAAEAQVTPPSIGGPNASQDNLASLLGKLRMPQMTIASERPAV